MEYTRLASSDEYRDRREELRDAEADLIRQREQVAEMRRKLPEGPTVEDYIFLEGPRDLSAGDEPVTKVHLSELFTGPDRSLVVYQFMYGKSQTEPCPMCTMWIDGWNPIAGHVAENVDLVIAAAADPPTLRAHARDRDWDRLRLLSCGDNSFKYDMGSETDDGAQHSTISVFTRERDGQVRHAYTAQPQFSDTDYQRGIDLLTPVWSMLDLTRGGRGDWYPSLEYR